MNLVAAGEGVRLAIDALRSNKVRASLTILGIVIGVATVVAMAAVIGGFRTVVTGELEAIGPKNFIVERFDQTKLQLVNSHRNAPWEGKPPITPQEAEMIRSLGTIRSVAAAIDANVEVRAGARALSRAQVSGRGYQWTDYVSGEFLAGRNFLSAEERRSAAVTVLSHGMAAELFPGVNPVGRPVRVGGELFTIIGVFRQKENLFASAMSTWALVPTTTALKRLPVNRDWMSLLVVPQRSATQDEAMDEVTAALRTARRLGPGDENNFALVRQEALLDLFNRITGAFFIVMLTLSSIGLMVGGIGVVAIMMISVTERTREIGVRKALGATRREILWQFLVESMTVTVIGGAIGLLLGGGGALLLGAFTPIPATVPLWSIAAALGVSAITGIGFGVYPASKAARLDPVEALRYE